MCRTIFLLTLSPLSSFSFLYNQDLIQLGDLYKAYKVGLVSGSSDWNKVWLSVYENHKNVGKITVELYERDADSPQAREAKHTPPYKLIKTITLEDSKAYLKPLIESMETYMQACGNGSSVDRFFESYVCYGEKSFSGLKDITY